MRSSAIRFFRKALNAVHTQEPRVINVDTVDKGVGTPDPNNLKNAAYPKAINKLKEKKELSEPVELRQNKYLNNRIDQDHRFIKWLVKPAIGFGSFNLRLEQTKPFGLQQLRLVLGIQQTALHSHIAEQSTAISDRIF